MKIKYLVIGLLVFMANSCCWAGEFEIEFMAGDSSFESGMHYKNELSNGFMKTGGYYFQTDDDDVEFKRWLVDFTFGSNMIAPELTCEVGLAGIFANAERQVVSTELVVDETAGGDPVPVETLGTVSGDPSAIAFLTRIHYIFPADMLIFPLELYTRIVYAPGSICFGDTEAYFSYQIGAGIRIIEYASLMIQYTAFDIDINSDARSWRVDESAVQLGLVFRF